MRKTISAFIALGWLALSLQDLAHTGPGYNGCHDINWTYHHHTHTCIQVFNDSVTWTEARDRCGHFTGGMDGTTPGHLLQVHDSDTDDFVKGLVPQSGALWIGLQFSSQDQQYAWDGSPNKVPMYTGFTKSPIIQPQFPNAILRKDGCRMTSPSMKFFYICQRDAVNGSCEDRTWKHKINDACFRLFQVEHTWTKARDECLTYQPGGQLVHIKDTSTNQFVKALLPDTQTIAFLGLHYVPELNDLRWVGLMDEELTFSDFTPTLMYSDLLSNVGVTKSSWIELPASEKLQYVCQHDALIARTQVTCPVQMAEDQSPYAGLIAGRFAFNRWSRVAWRVPYNADLVASCTRSDDGRTSCRNSSGFRATATPEGQVTLTYDGLLGTRHNGSWTFTISDSDGDVIESNTCPLQVYSPPSRLLFTSHVDPDSVTVTSVCNKVYPQPVWEWTFRNTDNGEFTPVEKTQVNAQIDHSYVDEGNIYFQSESSVTLTPDKTALKFGYFTVQARMYPHLQGHDLSTTADVVASGRDVIKIEPPEKAVFLASGQRVNGSLLSRWNGTAFELECQVNSGQPAVTSTTLACAFDVAPAAGNASSTTSGPGTSVRVSLTASPAMNGKRCTCWGNSMAGITGSASLAFDVTSGATVEGFLANGKSQGLNVDVNTTVTFTCVFNGNPAPTGNLAKQDRGGGYVILKETVGELKAVVHALTAQCQDSGHFRCAVRNMIGTQSREDFAGIDLRVKCGLTPCLSQRDKPIFATSYGVTLEVTLCVVAYPVPNVTALLLHKKSGETWDTPTLYHNDVTLRAHDGVLTSVTLTFPDVNETDVGQYKLTHAYNGDLESNFQEFELRGPVRLQAEAEPGDQSQAGSDITLGTGAAIGIGVVIGAVVVGAVLVLAAYKARRYLFRRFYGNKEFFGHAITNPIPRQNSEVADVSHVTTTFGPDDAGAGGAGGDVGGGSGRPTDGRTDDRRAAPAPATVAHGTFQFVNLACVGEGGSDTLTTSSSGVIKYTNADSHPSQNVDPDQTLLKHV